MGVTQPSTPPKRQRTYNIKVLEDDETRVKHSCKAPPGKKNTSKHKYHRGSKCDTSECRQWTEEEKYLKDSNQEGESEIRRKENVKSQEKQSIYHHEEAFTAHIETLRELGGGGSESLFTTNGRLFTDALKTEDKK